MFNICREFIDYLLVTLFVNYYCLVLFQLSNIVKIFSSWAIFSSFFFRR